MIRTAVASAVLLSLTAAPAFSDANGSNRTSSSNISNGANGSSSASGSNGTKTVASTKGGASKATPAKKRTVGILDVRLDGVPDEAKRQFERSLEEQLDTTAYWLSDRARMSERLNFSTKWVEGCLVGPCMTEVKTQTQAELALLVALSGQGTSFGFVVTVVRTDTGMVVAQDSGRCDVCTPREAMRDATLATINLLNNVPDTLPDEAALRVQAIDKSVGGLVRHMKHDQRRLRTRGLVITITGLVAAAAGTALYFANDKPDYALAIAGVGGGLTVGGVAMLTF